MVLEQVVLYPGLITSLIVRLLAIVLFNKSNYQIKQIRFNMPVIRDSFIEIQICWALRVPFLRIYIYQQVYKFAKLHFMREPTTIPEYKQFCKALKLKILKQKTAIESQSQQIQRLNVEIKLMKKSTLQPRNENDPRGSPLPAFKSEKSRYASEITDLETLAGKNQVMNKFKNGASTFGITPQSIFRIADVSYKSEVQADYFRQILAKIDLGLTPMEISCLIYIFDQNCTGFIRRDQYHDSLSAYRISQQESHLPYINICLQKLAKAIQNDKIQVLKFFQQMEGKSLNSVDMNRFHDKIRTTFGKRLQTREIIGAFNAIDLENDGIACKKNFVYSVTSAINKMLNHSAIKRSTGFDEHANNFQKSTLSNKKSQIFNGSSPHHENNDNSNSNTKPYRPQQSEPDEIDIVQKLHRQTKITLYQIYEEICRQALTKRLTLLQFKKIIQSLEDKGGKITLQLGSQLFKAIDKSQKGSIHYGDLMDFYLQYQNDMSIIFNLIGIYFKNNDLNGEKFWFLFGIGPDSDISKYKFLQVLSKSFGTVSNENWQKIWNYFDKGRGVVAINNINKQLKKYEIVD